MESGVGGKGRLQLNDVKSWDELEVPEVGSPHSIPEFERADPDQQIRESDAHTPRLTLAVDLSSADRDGHRYRLDGNTTQQIIKETLPAFATFRCIRSHDAVGEFEYGHDRDGDSFVTGCQRDVFEELAGGFARAFGSDGGRRIED